VADVLELAGAVLIIIGLALWAFPVALVVTGLFMVYAANAPAAKQAPDRARTR